MKNFRQFQGTQQLEFAYGLGDNEKNVTVIFGENGRGKTGIFRAIMFCLYGDHKLSQDLQVDEKELYLVNYPELEKAAKQDKKPVEAFVKLEFSHKRERYTLKRSIRGMLDGNEVIQELRELHLTKQTVEGNTIAIREPNEIDSIINAILDRGIREYFLFDGEKIERLTRASSEQRKEISKGLRNLLNIDALEVAIKAMRHLEKDLDAEIEKKSTGELAQVMKLLRENRDRQADYKEEINRIDQELEHAELEKKKIDKELDKIKEIKGLLDARTTLEARKGDLEDQANNLLLEMQACTGKASLLLVKKTVDRVFSAIDERKQKGEIPSEIRKDLIEKILTEKKCICGRDVSIGSDAFRCITIWKNRSTDAVIEDSMLNIWRHLGEVRSHFEDNIRNMETILQKYAVVKNEIEKVHKKLDEIESKIGSSERADAAKLDKHRHQIDIKLLKLENTRNETSERLSILEEEHTQLFCQREEKEREEGLKNELSKRASLATQAHKALTSAYNEFTQEVRKCISENASQFFQQLIDEESRRILKHIVVEDDYSIQILDRWGKPFLANISAGQRQIMSNSCIVALAKAAAKDKLFEIFRQQKTK